MLVKNPSEFTVLTDTIESMKLLSPSLGDVVKTKGFFQVGDEGEAKYTVESTGEVNEPFTFQFSNGYFGKLIVENKMNVMAFGAINIPDINNYDIDGNVDSVSQLRLAYNSGASTIVYPKNGHFILRDYLSINTKNNFTVLGNGSTVYSDNYFVDKVDETRVTVVWNSHNILIDGLNVGAKQTINLPNVAMQLGILDSTNVTVQNCIFRGMGPHLTRKDPLNMPTQEEINEIFTTPEYLALDEGILFSNIDLFMNWENVTIRNCEMYLSHDGAIGLSFMARDISGDGARGLVFENNYCEKFAHDEVISIGMINAVLDDMVFRNNDLIMYDGLRTSSPIAITVGSNLTGTPVKNVTFSDNRIYAQSHRQTLLFRNVENSIVFENNQFILSKGKGYNGEWTPLDIIEIDNAEYIDFDRPNDFKYILKSGSASSFAKGRINIANQTVDLQGIIGTAFGSTNSIVHDCSFNVWNYDDNNEVIAGDITSVAQDSKGFYNNTITGGFVKDYFTFYNYTINSDTSFTDNTFNITDDTKTQLYLIRMVNGNIQNNPTLSVTNCQFNISTLGNKNNYSILAPTAFFTGDPWTFVNFTGSKGQDKNGVQYTLRQIFPWGSSVPSSFIKWE